MAGAVACTLEGSATGVVAPLCGRLRDIARGRCRDTPRGYTAARAAAGAAWVGTAAVITAALDAALVTTLAAVVAPELVVAVLADLAAGLAVGTIVAWALPRRAARVAVALAVGLAAAVVTRREKGNRCTCLVFRLPYERSHEFQGGAVGDNSAVHDGGRACGRRVNDAGSAVLLEQWWAS